MSSFLQQVANRNRNQQRPPQYQPPQPTGNLMYDEGLAATIRRPAIAGSQGGLTRNFRQDDTRRIRNNLGFGRP